MFCRGLRVRGPPDFRGQHEAEWTRQFEMTHDVFVLFEVVLALKAYSAGRDVNEIVNGIVGSASMISRYSLELEFVQGPTRAGQGLREPYSLEIPLR